MFIRYRKGLSELKTTIIGIAGGTGSGKSTFTNRLKAHFGDRVTVIYHDDYYRAHDEIPFEQRQYINYDHPDSLETDLLVAHLKALREGRASSVPSTTLRATRALRRRRSSSRARSSSSRAS